MRAIFCSKIIWGEIAENGNSEGREKRQLKWSKKENLTLKYFKQKVYHYNLLYMTIAKSISAIEGNLLI